MHLCLGTFWYRTIVAQYCFAKQIYDFFVCSFYCIFFQGASCIKETNRKNDGLLKIFFCFYVECHIKWLLVGIDLHNNWTYHYHLSKWCSLFQIVKTWFRYMAHCKLRICPHAIIEKWRTYLQVMKATFKRSVRCWYDLCLVPNGLRCKTLACSLFNVLTELL